MNNCIMCKVEKAARKEFMEFLNWFAKERPVTYEEICREYTQRKK